MNERIKNVFVWIGAVSSLVVLVGLIVLVWGTSSGRFLNWLDSEIEFVIEAELAPNGTIGTQIEDVERLENQKIDAIDKSVKGLDAATASLKSAVTSLNSAVSKLQAQAVVLSNEIGVDASKFEAEATQLQGEISANASQITSDSQAAATALADASKKSQSALAGICDYINSTARRKKDIPAECAGF